MFLKFQLFTKQNFGFLKKGTIIGMWQILRLFYASFVCSDFRFAHFCLPWPYTLSYRNLIVTGRFRTVRPFCRTQKLCWNMKNKGSFDVGNTKIPIIVPFFKNPKFCLVKSWNFEKILVSARRPQNSGSETALYIPLLLPI